MKTIKSVLALSAISSAMLFATNTHAQDVDNRANVYGGISRFVLDSDHSRENDTGWLVGGELPLSERWSATLEHWDGSAETDNGVVFPKADLSYNRIGGNYHLDMTDSWQPYLAVGVGNMDVDPSVSGDDDDTNFDIGLGFKSFFSENLMLRGDAKAILGSNRDFLVGLSLGYVFGGNSPAPQPTPEPEQPMDSDGDGVFDAADSCRNTPAGASVDSRGCELDSDQDSVVDSRDSCPDTAMNLAVDNRGCTITETIEYRQTLLVNFDTNQAVVKPEYNSEIQDFADFMNNYTVSTAVIEGHTDSDGAENYNEDLSQRRATAVMNAIIDHGIAASRLSAIGYGESRPVATNSTTEGKATNRRIEALVTAEEEQERSR